MDNILIPIDYSSVTSNVLKYAMKLFTDAKFTVLHVNDRSLQETYSTLEGSSAATYKLGKFVSKCLEMDELPNNIKPVIRYGTIVPTIREYLKQNEFDCVVMGTRDKHNLFDNWFGTVSLGVVKSTQIPTFIIPKYAEFNGYKKVVVATDKHLKDTSFIRIIKNWNTEFNAFIKFIHVQDGTGEDFKAVEKKIIKELYEDNDVSFGFEVERIEDKKISDSLLASAYNYGADLMIAIPDNQSYINALLFKSMTKELTLKSDIPLLFIHPNNFVY